MPVIGKVSDRIGRKIFVAAGLLLFSVISLFYPLADNIYTLTAIRLIHGLAAGMIMPIVMAYIGDFTEKGREGFTTGAMNMMFYLGFAAGPLLGGYLDQHFGFNTVFHVMAALGFITFLIVIFFLPDVKIKNKEVGQGTFSFKGIIRYNFIKAILIIAIIATLILVVFVSFIPSLAGHLNVNTEHIGLIISFAILIAGLLQIPMGKIADKLDRFGKLVQISIGMVIAMITVLVLPLCPDFAGLMTAAFFIGLGTAVSTPAISALAVNIGSRVGMGSWMGILNAARSIGFILSPLLFGITMDYLGIDAVFYLLGLIVFLGIFVYGYYIRKRMTGHRTG